MYRLLLLIVAVKPLLRKITTISLISNDLVHSFGRRSPGSEIPGLRGIRSPSILGF